MKVFVLLMTLSLFIITVACQDDDATVAGPADTLTPSATVDPVPTSTPQPTLTSQPSAKPSPTPESVPTSTLTLVPSPTPWPTLPTVEPLEIPLRGSGVFEPISSAANAEMRLGRAALESGEFEKALAHLQKGADLQGEPSAAINSWIAITYRRMGKYDLSIAHYSEAIALDDRSLLRVARAFVYWHNGQCAEAIADAETALNMAPAIADGSHSHANAHGVLAFCYYDAGQVRKELEHLRAALPLMEEHGYSQRAILSAQEKIALIIEELGER